MAKSEEMDLFISIREGCPLAPALNVTTAKALCYLLQIRMAFGQIKGIPLPGPDGEQLVNRHFADGSFFAIQMTKKL
jgi:hypothetical protein